MKLLSRMFFGALLLSVTSAAAAPALARLKVSDNHRFLVNEQGEPFFYLGDTAWELFHRLTREEATAYLQDRASKGFTVIQAVALAEMDGLNTPNAYGAKPLENNDPTQPNEAYFAHVDWIVNKANSLGLFIGFLPTWGDKWNRAHGVGPEIFTPANADAYGEWLGRRYKEAGVIWILGGDRKVESDAHRQILGAMAHGLRRGDEGRHLITLHPRGGSGSAESFHQESWLDFNMRQNGHGAEFTGRYDQTQVDYERTPIKPLIDGEPIYEDHPLSFKPKELGYSVAADTRRALYWDLFSGACGHTYGNHAVWQMFDPKRVQPVNSPLMEWRQAIAQPGAGQMQYARKLLESRPILSRIPDDSVLVEAPVRNAMPGTGTRHFVATRDSANSYVMVYAPIGRKFSVHLDRISGSKVKAWWFNPRNGTAIAGGEYANTGEHEFLSPDPGELLDWVLVLDDAEKGFPPPGQSR